ncbi:MAG: iron uptake system protein EfeO [Rhodoglobus sp.]|uniref:iron uptake system protein EfeO n=1 Tax=Salinibacterium sp. G-O1 TaxID=3046208 RepID=UPI0024BAB396|nr:iron uptake system protein EfeO [Salinibacterium sp. G-O1]MDJ0334485.1 peptidase M75 family protein [Salinibacterium sp. G-O1]
MPNRLLIGVAGAATLALALSGCVPNNAASTTALTVAITDDTCAVSDSTAAAGAISFSITNSGTGVNEFYIFAEDKLRIVGEKENITPGQTASFVAQLEPGTYYTACKFERVGAPIGVAEFTVTGDTVTGSTSDRALEEQAVTNYIAYITSQVDELVPQVAAFATAYAAGDDETARSLFASARVSYERIEPTAEAFGDLDPKIDYREVDATAEGLDWTGFHRMEKDLWAPQAGDLNSDGESALLDWAPSTPQERQDIADGLVANVQELSDLVNADDFTVTLADISNGAIALLDEVAVGKISGEEDWWSHSDLYDFFGNVQGAEVAFGNVKDIASSKGAESSALVDDIEAEFAALKTLLGTYGSLESGFTSYDTVTAAERKALSNQVNALAEPLSNLTHIVLGVAE